MQILYMRWIFLKYKMIGVKVIQDQQSFKASCHWMEGGLGGNTDLSDIQMDHMVHFLGSMVVNLVHC